jgi:hypothetical protein
MGWNSRGWDGGAVADASLQRNAKDRSALIARALRQAPHAGLSAAADAPLHEESSGSPSGPLQGTIFISSHPLQGFLAVDGETVARRSGDTTKGALQDAPREIQLSYGMHTIAWVDNNGNTLFREKIHLLPFETRIVSMAAAVKEKRPQ